MPHSSPFLESEPTHTNDVGRPPDPAEALRLIAHQLRQPLSTIQAIAYFLSMTLPETETRAHEQIEKLQRLVEDTDGILSDAIHFFQASPLRPAAVCFDEFVGDTVAQWKEEGSCELVFEPEAGPALASLDKAQAAHVVRNALFYLRQVSMPGAALGISTWGTGPEVALSLWADSSVAGAEETEALLDERHPRLGSGSGLAMASVRRIVTAHEGRIQVRPWLANGVELTVFFPRRG